MSEPTHDLPTPTETRHGPEPWRVGHGREGHVVETDDTVVCELRDEGDYSDPRGGPDAHRIVQCVNACASIPGDPGEGVRKLQEIVRRSIQHVEDAQDRHANDVGPEPSKQIAQLLHDMHAALKGEGGGETS